MANDEIQDDRPWSARKPQNYILSALMIVLAIALVRQGFTYVSAGVGGLVPYLIIVGGPVLAVYYTWYFTIRKFGNDPR